MDSSGNVVVTGTLAGGSPLYGGTGNDLYTAKYTSADGTLVWDQTHHTDFNDYDVVQGVAIDASGNVIISGTSGYANPVKSTDLYTAKYAAVDGALLWERHYNNQWNDDDKGFGVAVDRNGDVIVTGRTYNGSVYPFYTAKYAGETGALLWEKRGSFDGAPRALALDGSGNVVVAGYIDTGGSYNFYTAKYAATNGALLWEKRYTGAGNGDGLTAVATDASGNVLVTGVFNHPTNGGGYNSGSYTAKYAAANGALLWEKRQNTAIISGLVVDGSGNVLVTGTDSGDNYTAAYAGADGALLWEKRSQVLGYEASGLALGPDGRIAVTGTSSGVHNVSSIATVLYQPPLPPLAIDSAHTGIHLRFTGVAGHSYNIERAPAVTGPWSTLATPTAALDGLVDYTDTNPPPGTAFYRTSAP